jgi:hypothetical protein
LNLPPNPPGPYTSNLTFASDFTLGSYFTAVFGTPAIPAGLDVVQGTSYKAWCVEFNDGIVFTGGPTIFTAANAGPFTFRNSLGSLPADAQSPNWGAVNWLLNNKGANNVIDIQEAIWILLNGKTHTNQYIAPFEPGDPPVASAATNALVTNALANRSFVPTAGQLVAVLLDGGDGLVNDGTDKQSLIIEVTVPPAPPCTITPVTISNTSWNHFNVPGGTSPVVWIHAHIGTPSNITGTTTVNFTGVVFSLNGVNYPLPDGLLTFDSAAPPTITTTFNAGLNRWETLINPNDLSDEIFFTGAAIPVSANIAAGGKANLTYSVSTSDKLLSYSWQWSAAVFTYWPTDWNQAEIQPFHQSLHAGTPLNKMVQQSLIQGPRGGGGSNFTGSWSATGTASCPVQ